MTENRPHIQIAVIGGNSLTNYSSLAELIVLGSLNHHPKVETHVIPDIVMNMADSLPAEFLLERPATHYKLPHKKQMKAESAKNKKLLEQQQGKSRKKKH